MIVPDPPAELGLSPIMVWLGRLGLAALALLFVFAAWVVRRMIAAAKELWSQAQIFAEAKATVAKVPMLEAAVFGTADHPGILPRLEQAEGAIVAVVAKEQEVRDLLGLSDPEMKRAMIRSKLLGEDTGPHQVVQPAPKRPPPRRDQRRDD